MPVKLKPYLGPEDSQVKAALAGIYRSGSTIFFVIDQDGKHCKVNVSHKLRLLEMSWGDISKLIKVFPFPEIQYKSDSMKAVEAAKGRPKGPHRKCQSPCDPEEDELDDSPEEETVAESKSNKTKQGRYSLVEQGHYWGCYDNQDAVQKLFKTREEAEDCIRDLLHGRDSFKVYYGHSAGDA